MSAYQSPNWAQPPASHEWYLTEIKGGVQVTQHALHSQPCTVLGRAADQVHIPLQHESSSRQHARIAFDAQGIPWLKDLGSTHGTKYNKRPLPAPAVGKQESNATHKGARGVMIFPGDILQFGASTRIYCVEGPADFDRGTMQAKQKQQELLQRELQQQQLKDEPETDTSPDEDPATSLSSSTKTVAMDAPVPEKHRKMLERLNGMKYKLQNLEVEDERIRRKGELSEGQERQLQRNEERENKLRESIAELEAELYDKLHPEKAKGTAFQQTSAVTLEDGNDENDEFFDRTKRTDKSVVQDGESESTLVSKWKHIQQKEHIRTLKALPQAQALVDQLASKQAAMEARGEAEEAFYVQNDLQLAKEKWNKLQEQATMADQNLTEIEKLLHIVNPKVQVDRSSGYIGEGDPPSASSDTPTMEPSPAEKPSDSNATMLPPPSQSMGPPTASPPGTNNTKGNVQSSSDFVTMLPPPSPRVPANKQTETDLERDATVPDRILPSPVSTSAAGMPPPNKRKRVVGPAMPPTVPSSATETTASSSKAKLASQPGTLAFLSSMNKMFASHEEGADNVNDDDSSSKGLNKTKTKTTLDHKMDTWRAPEGQDGSGRTKLNDKFAGRY